MTRRLRKLLQSDHEVEIVGRQTWDVMWSTALPPVIPSGPPPGKGWKTAVQVSVDRNIPRKTAEQHLREACQRGTLERMARRTGRNGTMTYFYRPLQSKP